MTSAVAAARVFVALPLGPELGARVAAEVEGALRHDAWRLTRPDSLHATLAFHGAFAREALPALRSALDEALAALPRPSLRLEGTGAFPGAARANVLWIGVAEREPRGRLEACCRAAAGAFARIGSALPDAERPFHPHVTLARPRRGRARAPEEFTALALDLPWEPAAVVLFESRSEGGGHRHDPLATWPFADAG